MKALICIRSAEKTSCRFPGSRSGDISCYPLNIAVHPAPQELFSVCTEIAGLAEQAFLVLDEGFGLARRWHVQVVDHENLV